MLSNCLNSHILKLRLHFLLEKVHDLAVAKSYGFKNFVKLGRGRAYFKNTLEERPSEKSCSTSFFELENDNVQKVSILFSHVHLFLVVSQLRNIPGLVNKSLMGSKFGFENFGSLVQKPPRGEAFFHLTSL